MNQSSVTATPIAPDPHDVVLPQQPNESVSRPLNLSGRALRTLISGLPTLLILSLLVGIAWLGHNYNWSLPKFSRLTSTPIVKGPPWCDEHGVPADICIACKPDLMPKSELVGWCREHGVHECVLHNPELGQLRDPVSVNDEDLARAQRAIDVRPRTKNDPSCKMHLRRIQFASTEAVDRAGIDIALVDRSPVIETVQASGEILYDPTRVAHLSSRAAGTLWRVDTNVGDRVREQDVLAIVDAVEVGRTKSLLLEKLVELDLAEKTANRLQKLGDGVIPAKQLQEAESARASAAVAVANAAQMLSNLGLEIDSKLFDNQPIEAVRKQLQFLGLSETGPDSASMSTNLLPVYASRDGVIVKRNAVAGEVVEAGQPLFTIADTSQVWLLLNVPLEEADRIAVGQKVVFRADGSNRDSTGSVSWISTDVDPVTRTVQIRGELDNDAGWLRDGTFGSGQIVLREEPDAIVVPAVAIHWEGCCNVAFVRDRDYFDDGSYKVFHTRSIRPGASIDGHREVIAGLLPGEVVVTEGSGILRAELLKGNLGAG